MGSNLPSIAENQYNFLAVLNSETCRDVVARGLESLAEMTDPDYYYSKGEEARINKDYMAAIAWYEKALAKKPYHRDALLGCALCLMPDPKEQKLLGTHYDRVAWATKLETINLRLVNLELAEPKEDKLYIYRAYGNLGYAHLQLGLPRQAVKDYEDAFNYRRNGYLLYNYALAKERMGLFDDAQNFYEESLSLEPNYALANYGFARFLDYIYEEERAMTQFIEFLNNANLETDPYINENDILYAQRRIQVIEEEIKREMENTDTD